MATKTSKYGYNYVGNDDFRGFLAANRRGYLPFTGNDGRIDAGKVEKLGYDSKIIGEDVGRIYTQYNQARSRSRANTPRLDVNSLASGGGYGYGSSSGGGGGGSTVSDTPDPAMLAYYDDQERRSRQGLNRLGTQQRVGLSNIRNSYNEAYNDLTQSKGLADRDLGTARTKSLENNRETRARIDRNTSNASVGLQRLLGSIGAGRSSASRVLAPFAVASQGNENQRGVQKDFAYNMQALDTEQSDLNREFSDNKKKLAGNRQAKANELLAGLKQTRAGILESLSNIALQRAQAKGLNYAQARGAMTPYTSQINSLLRSIDRLGKNATVQKVGNIKFNAPSLRNYDFNGITVDANTGTDPIRQQTGAYYNLTNDDERERLGLL